MLDMKNSTELATSAPPRFAARYGPLEKTGALTSFGSRQNRPPSGLKSAFAWTSMRLWPSQEESAE